MRESRVYDVNLLDSNVNSGDSIFIQATMLFRPFKPQMINQFHAQSNQNIPVITMDRNTATIIVP